MTDADYLTRKYEVHRLQTMLNMQPRSDSVLTERYARGETHLSAEEVARELMATDFLYTHTLYGELLEEFMREVAERVRAIHHPLSWTATWNIVRAYAPDALKLMLVSSSGVRIPERLVPNETTHDSFNVQRTASPSAHC